MIKCNFTLKDMQSNIKMLEVYTERQLQAVYEMLNRTATTDFSDNALYALERNNLVNVFECVGTVYVDLKV